MLNLQKRVVGEFVELVKIDSLSLREEKVFNYLKKRFNTLSLQVEFQEYAIPETNSKSGNLIVKIPATTKNKKSVFFDSHVDTVEPGIGINPIVHKDRITSDGKTILGSDDKAGTAAMVIAIEDLIKNPTPHGDLYFIFTSAEEIGLTGVQNLDMKNIKAEYGFILDSHGSVGGVIVAAPHHYHYEMTLKGKASHAGIAPDKGTSAIKAAGPILSALPQGKINRNTVANIGIIDGGAATNIVSEKCTIKGEFRSHSLDDIELLKQKITALAEKNRKNNIEINLVFEEMYKGFAYSKADPIIGLVNKAIKEIGIKPRFERTGGGSNTNIYNQNKIKSLTLAIGMENLHSTDEYILIKDLVDLTLLIKKIAELA